MRTLAVVVLVGLAVAACASESAPEPDPPAGAATAGGDLRSIDLGAFESGEPIAVTVEDGDVGFLLTAVNDDPEAETAVVAVVDPSGAQVYEFDLFGEEFLVTGPLTSAERLNPGEVSLMIPAHPGLGVRPGTWEVTVDSDNGGALEAAVLVKSGDASPDLTQALDFNVWLAQTDPALADEEFQDAFGADIRAEMDAVLGPHNLEVGSIGFFVADPDAVADFAAVDEDQFDDACRQIADDVGLDRAVNIGFVEELVDPEVDEVAGVSTGLPGAVLDPDASATCVLAAQTAYGDSLAEHAANFLHEASHFMGLTHTTEDDGVTFDDFADTPECDAATYDGRDSPEEPGEVDGFVTDFECGIEGGAGNYLFYGGEPEFAPFQMSADQAWALRRHPLLYPVP